MRSKLFKLAARISTVLCVLALALSFRSHWRGDRVRYVHENWTASLTSDDGTLRLAVTAPSAFGRRGGTPGWSFASSPASRTSVSFDGTAYEGFGHAVGTFQLPPDGRAVRVRRWWAPHWSLVLAFAILPAIYAIRHRLAQQRADESLRCPACGQELIGSPERCPQCGAELTATEREGAE